MMADIRERGQSQNPPVAYLVPPWHIILSESQATISFSECIRLTNLKRRRRERRGSGRGHDEGLGLRERKGLQKRRENQAIPG